MDQKIIKKLMPKTNSQLSEFKRFVKNQKTLYPLIFSYKIPKTVDLSSFVKKINSNSSEKQTNAFWNNILMSMVPANGRPKEDFYDEEVSDSLLGLLTRDIGYFYDGPKKVKTVEDLVKLFPEDKKYRRLIFQESSNLKKMFVYWALFFKSSVLIKSGLNKDVVFNHLQSLISKDKEEGFTVLNYNDFGSGVLVQAKFAKFLKKSYQDNRICQLILQPIESEEVMDDTLDCVGLYKGRNLDYKNFMPRQPKTIDEIHDYMFERFEEEQIISSSSNYDLNQREDFLKIDNKEIEVLGQKLVVKVPKTRHELAVFSRKSVFDNCVGKSDHYAEGVKEGRWSILGLFDSKNNPVYCIQTSKYTFIQAKGVSNSSVPKDVFFALESLITVKPELPSDFIPVEHSFIFGYSYNPKTNSMFVMFRKQESVYEYMGVPLETYENFAKEKNKGQILNKDIKKFPCQKMR